MSLWLIKGTDGGGGKYGKECKILRKGHGDVNDLLINYIYCCKFTNVFLREENTAIHSDTF